MTARRSSRVKVDAETLERSLGPLPEPEERPVFVVMSGLPGSGKSHVANEVAKRYPLAVLHIDALRKALFPRPVYTQSEHDRLFAAVHALIDGLLSRGICVVYDATNLKEVHRRVLYDIGERNDARMTIVRVYAREEEALKRLRDRHVRREKAWSSDADAEVYETMRLESEPIQRPYVEVDATGDVTTAVDKIVQDLRGE